MTAAVALAVVLVIAVAGMSLAMQTQRPVQQARPAAPRRARERRPSPPPPSPPPPSESVAAASKGPELLRSGTAAEAKVISVVDERTLGPVTRSRLALSIHPEGSDTFEVTIRVAFPTPDARAKVRVGATVRVRFDPEDRTRVVLDPGT
ncbi:MAG: hypothetical protein ACYC1D_00115 [Acidimicrobiales bacterium]